VSGGHFTLDELRACARGEDPTLIDPVVKHCRDCEECGEILAGMMALLRRQRMSSAIPGFASPGLRVRGVLQCVAAVVVVSSLLLFALWPESNSLANLATTEPPPGMIVDIHVRMSQVVPADIGGGPSIREGSELMLAGEYTAAITVLERELTAHPDSELVALYLGIARYLAGDDSPRVRDLLSAGAGSRNQSIETFGAWYLANHLLRAGNTGGATDILESLSTRTIEVGRKARALLGEIAAASTPR
jgi:hypothetical protein